MASMTAPSIGAPTSMRPEDELQRVRLELERIIDGCKTNWIHDLAAVASTIVHDLDKVRQSVEHKAQPDLFGSMSVQELAAACLSSLSQLDLELTSLTRADWRKLFEKLVVELVRRKQQPTDGTGIKGGAASVGAAAATGALAAGGDVAASGPGSGSKAQKQRAVNAGGGRGGGTNPSTAAEGATQQGYVALPWHRVLVLEEDAFNNFEALVKHVEFRNGTNRTVRPGMFLLFTNGWAARRRGRTGLLVAEVAAVHHCSVEEAYRRFPTDAIQCNLRMRSARWTSRVISCIEVQNVRPAPEFRVLAPGNLGFLHQFSLEKGTPQFCLASDLEARPAAADTAGAAAAAG